MQLTWVDILFVGVFIYFAFKGWSQGILYLSASFIAFVASLFLALRYAGTVSVFLSDTFGLGNRWAGLLAYFLISFAAEAIISELMSRVLSKAPAQMAQGKTSQILGAFVSATSGLFLITLIIFILLLVPIRGTIKQDIRSSLIAPRILSLVEVYGGPLPGLLKDSAKSLTQFMTVEPNSKESLSLELNVTEKDLQIDDLTEEQMVTLVNKERTSIGVGTLTVSESVTEVARAYAKRMMLEKFFSHYDKQGHDVAFRLEQSDIRFQIAGENLAYAPDLTSAHDGLMHSEGHRRNILDNRFSKIGIGVIDAGIWGKMFVQVFTD